MDSNLFWDWFFALFAIAFCIAMGAWVWRLGGKEMPTQFWKPLGLCSLVIAMSAGGQLGARGVTQENIGFALIGWTLLTAVCAAILGVRHLLTSRQRG